MRKILLAAAGFAALSAAAGLAVAQEQGGPHGRGHLFEAADANNDGVVTRQEFDAGRDTMFARMDANGDGQLTGDERRMGRHGRHRGGMGAHMSNADANNDGAITRDEFLAGPIAHFNELDANHDGVLSADERPQPRQGMRGERGERHARLDTNGDGQISRSEFGAMGAAMFDRLDANHDGRVTREEAQAAHAQRRRS